MKNPQIPHVIAISLNDHADAAKFNNYAFKMMSPFVFD